MLSGPVSIRDHLQILGCRTARSNEREVKGQASPDITFSGVPIILTGHCSSRSPQGLCENTPHVGHRNSATAQQRLQELYSSRFGASLAMAESALSGGDRR